MQSAFYILYQYYASFHKFDKKTLNLSMPRLSIGSSTQCTLSDLPYLNVTLLLVQQRMAAQAITRLTEFDGFSRIVTVPPYCLLIQNELKLQQFSSYYPTTDDYAQGTVTMRNSCVLN